MRIRPLCHLSAKNFKPSTARPHFRTDQENLSTLPSLCLGEHMPATVSHLQPNATHEATAARW